MISMKDTKRTQRRPARWWMTLALPLALLVASCTSSGASRAATTTSTPTATQGTSTTTPPITHSLPPVTPVPGNYSIYVDPTWGYSFEYPSDWIVYPAIGTGDNGAQESSVDILQPYTTDETHPYVHILVRATNNLQDGYVESKYCGQQTTATVDGFPAVVLDTGGGDPTVGYGAPALGRIFVAKGIAFEIWFESSAKESWAIAGWFQFATPIFKHILATFNPGPGTKTVAQC